MDQIHRLAVLSVRRGCGFAGLAIATVMAGLMFDHALAFKSGAALTAIVAIVLLFRGIVAPRRNFRETEVWYLLPRDSRPPGDHGGRVINGILRDVYLQHAEWAAVIAVGLWLVPFIGQVLPRLG
jgi:multisubunit Na+/H+ antiporter MnhB subunit